MTYRLPDGNLTENNKHYAQAWRELAEPLIQKFGWRLYAFDPSFSFAVRSGEIIQLSAATVADMSRDLERE